MTVQTKLRYPRKSQIDQVVSAAKSCGLDVAGIEVSPDGTIRIMEARAMRKDSPANDFDRLQDFL